VWDAKAHHLCDSGMVHHDLINFTRADFFTTAVDDFFQPSRDTDVSLAVHHALVTCAKPTVCERFSVRLVVVLVAGSDVRSTNHDFTGVTGFEQVAVQVHDGDFRPSGSAYSAGFALCRRQRVASHLVRCFGHAVGFNHRRMKRNFQLGQHLRRQ